MNFLVTAKQYGDSIQWVMQSDDLLQARKDAKAEARRAFEYQGSGDDPSVSLKQIAGEEE